MWRPTHFALALAACLTLAGCGGTKPAARYRITVIPKGLTHEFWQSIHRGAERAQFDLQRQGITVDVLWEGPRTESDAQAQIDIMNRSIANRVHGIVLAPQHSRTMVAPVEAAVQKGIPVVIIDSGLENQDIIVKYVATDNYHGGQLAAEHLLKVLRQAGKPAPKLILFRYAPGSESTEQREKGFEDYVNGVIAEQKKKGQPTIAWLSTDKYAGATTDSALKEATPLLNGLQDQEIDGIFAVNESSATGMLMALKSLGLNKKVHLMGFDSSPPLLQAVAEGDIDGLILQDPFKMGYLGVWTLVQHLEGANVSPDGNKVLSTGEFVATRENVDSPHVYERFDEKFQRERTIETPKVIAAKDTKGQGEKAK
jgi:ribose transport system substrate-binding protein